MRDNAARNIHKMLGRVYSDILKRNQTKIQNQKVGKFIKMQAKRL
jgi:hypothetical protein